MEKLAVAELDRIRVGSRRRKKLGRLASLKKSIEAHGLLHPIIVTDDGLLVAGQRRLEACRALGWKTIPIRRWGELSEEELREIELDENVCRDDLDSYEQSAQRLAEVERAIEEAEEEYLAQSARKRGRPTGGDAAASRKTGLHRRVIRDSRRHVQTADAHAFMKGKQWRVYHVVEAAEKIEGLPQQDREPAVKLMGEAAQDPRLSLRILDNLIEKPVQERREIFRLYGSDNKEDVSLAKTKAAKLPPIPPPRLMDLSQALHWIKKAASRKRDDRAIELRKIAGMIESIFKDEQRDYETAKEQA